MDNIENTIIMFNCSFCGKNCSQVEFLVKANIASICTDCIEIAYNLVQQKREEHAKTKSND